MIQVTLIGPEASVFTGDAEAVTVPAYDGQVGILPNHAPFMTLLGKGTLTVKQGGAEHRFNVQGGFLQVVSNRVRVVAEQVAPA
ncbi:MAG: ATP synthase F1 subunit epsilon [Gemmatimonadetes bacterium]|nr:ATP synthase F1 subunit epsilon [Gemmatimonadota bacterium]